MNLTQLASVALLPPFSLFVLLAWGLLILRRRPRLGRSLIVLGTGALYLLSTSWVGGMLQNSLEISPPINLAQLKTADAIVVLAGGTYYGATEYGGDTPNAISLERLRYAVRLHRASGLPLLVTGGIPGGGALAEGRVLQQVLQDEYDIAPRWVEDAARSTWDNARLSAPLLRQSGVRRIALVSHAWHLRRAVPLFQSQGLDVIPAGTQFSSTRIGSPVDLLPTPAGLRASSYALHEWLGILWYKLRTIIA